MKQRLLWRRLRLILLALCATTTHHLLAQQIEGHRLISWQDAKGAIKIPDGVTELADNALKGNRSITHIDLNEVRIVGAGACSSLERLSGIYAPNVEELKDRAFYKMGNQRGRPAPQELIFPKCRRIGSEAITLAATSANPLTFVALPVVEKMAANALGRTRVRLLDLSRAPLSEVVPNAWSSGSIAQILISTEAEHTALSSWDSEAHYLLASQLPDTSTEPSLSIRAGARKGYPISTSDIPLLYTTRAGALLAIDLGDGQIRYTSTLDEDDTYHEYALHDRFFTSPVDQPTIKVYGAIEKLTAFRLKSFESLHLSESLLSRLEVLYTSGNVLPSDILAQAVQLKELRMRSRGEDTSINRLDLSRLTQLKELSLVNLTALRELILASGVQLRKIHINSSPEWSVVPWDQLRSAESIELTGCNLFGAVDLSACSALKELDLSENKLTSLKLPSASLTSFRCWGNQIEHIDLVESPADLASVTIYKNRLSSSNLNTLYEKLTDRSNREAGKLYVLETLSASPSVDNDALAAKRELLVERNWTAVDASGRELTDMIVRGDTLVSWGTASGDVVLPPEVRVINWEAFMDNDKVTSITGPNVEYISALIYMKNLTKLDFPKFKGRDKGRSNYYSTMISNYSEYDNDQRQENRPYKEEELVSYNSSGALIRFVPKLGLTIANHTLLYVPRTYEGELKLPDHVTKIEQGVLAHCDKITKVSGANVREIERWAFNGCTALTEVDFPNLEQTEGYVFSLCNKLRKVTSKKGVWLWRDASGTVTFPEGTEVLGPRLFIGNKQVTGVQWPSTLKRIGASAFEGTQITEAILPETVTSIGRYAFCSSAITRAVVPESVERMGYWAFNKCDQLTEIRYMAKDPNLIQGFAGGSSLRRVTIGAHTIGLPKQSDKDLLINVSKKQLDELICYSPEPILLTEWAKPLGYTKRLYVPAGLVEVYRAYLSYYHSEDDIEILPIAGTEGAKQITLSSSPDYQVYVEETSGARRQIQSGERLPAGTELRAYVLPAPGKVVTALLINGRKYDLHHHRFYLTEDITLSASVETVDLNQYEELYSIDYAGRARELQMHSLNLYTQGADGRWWYRPRDFYWPQALVDLGGGRYAYCKTLASMLDYLEDTPSGWFAYGEDNPRVRYYFPKEYIAEQGQPSRVNYDAHYVVDFFTENRGFQAARPDLCFSVNIDPVHPTGKKDHRIPLPDLSLMTNLREIDIELVRLKVTACQLNDFYSNLPRTTSGIINISGEDRNPAFEASDISLARSKGWVFRKVGNPDTGDKVEVTSTTGGGCRDAYALSIETSGAEGITYKYIEDGVEKAMPTSVPRGKAVKIVALYNRDSYEDPRIRFRSEPEGYSASWSDEDGGYAVAFTMEQDIHLSFAFSAKVRYYSVRAERSTGGAYLLSGASDYSAVAEGTTIGVEVYPDRGYELERILANGVDITATRRFSVTANTTVRVTFRRLVYQVVAEPSAGGSITLSGASNLTEVPHGTTIGVEVRASEGYELESLTANGVDIMQTRAFTVTADTRVRASFRKRVYQVVAEASAGGSITLIGADDLTAVPHGSTISVEVRADEGYELESLTANGVDIMQTRAFAVTADTRVRASFRKRTYRIEVEASAGGSITLIGADDLTAVPHGSTISVEVRADEGYELESLMVYGLDITAKRVFGVLGDARVQASFRKRTYRVSLPTVEHARLSIKGNPNLDRVEHGTELELVVDAESGYEVDEVRISSRVVDAPYRFVVDGNIPIVVRMRQKVTIESVDAVPLRLYPNPATSYVTLEGIEVGTEVRLMTLQGKVALTTLIDESRRIDVSALDRGLYILQIAGRGYKLVLH